MPWNPITRNEVAVLGASESLRGVGSTKEINLRKCRIRGFAPPRSPMAGYHGAMSSNIEGWLRLDAWV
jgi:hypothetical protein